MYIRSSFLDKCERKYGKYAIHQLVQIVTGAMVLLFLLMLLRMVVLARRAEDSFGCYLIIGVMAMMFFHVFENISMVIGLMPVTGIPLPFVSYGGSSYFTNIIGIGLVINVAMRSKAGVARQPRPVSNPAKLIR